MASFDGRFVFSIGTDGILFVYKVKEINCEVPKQPTQPEKSKSPVKAGKAELVKEETKEEVVKGLITIPPEDQIRADN